jgi:transposase
MRVTEEDVARMRELRRQGLSYRAIGREIGCSDNTVRYHLIPAFREGEKARSRAYHTTNTRGALH